MREINIAKMLTIKRKEKGVTQDELAAYIGVTKASVSKWETGQSYPDITFLPELAAYFSISIDELIGYEPQMTKYDIKKLYNRLSYEFSSKPFDEVMEECSAIIKKYYSCFPLLLQMSILLVNHYMLAMENNEQEAILEEIIELCVRVKTESGDIWLSKHANSIEATCHLILQHPGDVLELLDGTMKPTPDDEAILAQAYQMSGNILKANEILQISIFSNLIKMTGSLAHYLLLYAHEAEKFEEILHRTFSAAELFDLDRLHPHNMLMLYLAAANGYAVQHNNEKALNMLKRYADVCTTDSVNFSLHGDIFFDSIDGFFDELELGSKLPRDEKVIKKNIVQCVISNPVFAALTEHPRYKSIVETLKSKLEVC